MSRLVLVDTVDQLPGLLPLHAWTALSTTDLILLGDAAHPLAPHFDIAELRYEIVPEPAEPAALTRRDLLGGVDPVQRAKVTWIVDRAREAGAAAYVYGAADAEGFTRALGFEAARSQVEVEVVYFGLAPKGVELLGLVEVEERLRGPDGCPWDREQDHASLASFAVEEVHELTEAIAGGAPEDICEELGDVLLQVVFHAQIAQDQGTFDIDAVAKGIVDKLVRRHPHVFGDVRADDAATVMANWEQLKAAEKPEREGPFDGVASAQPALPLTGAVQRRAAKLGFDRADAATALAEVRAQVDAVARALAQGDDAPAPSGAPASAGASTAGAPTEDAGADGGGDGGGDGGAGARHGHLAHEIGDLLAAIVALARHVDVDPELALRASTARFRTRFEQVLSRAGRPPAELSSDEWRRLWEAAS